MAPRISNVVVLMFENRSFDHLLGFFRPDGRTVNGLTGEETQLFDVAMSSDPAVLRAKVRKTSDTLGYITDPDPGHEFEDVNVHLFGTTKPRPGSAPDNSGFLARYAQQQVGGNTIPPRLAERVLWSFDTATQLPALHALASNFVVCDNWFASVPGPTWPNRFFAHCASSGDLYESPPNLTAVWSDIGHSNFGMPTVYENLQAAGHSWAIYYHDVPQALGLARLHHHRDRFAHFSVFLDAVKGGTLPEYSFIEPGFFNSSVLGLVANDMHPAHDVRHGDKLIADVYNALRASPLFESTLLVILWDEHGGFYDHVPPGPAVPPDGSPPPGFAFDRLGVRVPAILVSPYLTPSTDSTLYDHSSIPASLKQIFQLPTFLTRRDARANTFPSPGLWLDAARDTPPLIPSALGAAAAPASVQLTDSQQKLLAIAKSLKVSGTSALDGDSVEAHILHIARYLDV